MSEKARMMERWSARIYKQMGLRRVPASQRLKLDHFDHVIIDGEHFT
jgi:hypothetical protein